MKILSHVIHWVVDLFPSARRARDQQRVSPQQLREALAEMLNDPEINRLLRKSLMGTVIPIAGGVCTSSTTNYIPKFVDTSCDVTNTVAPIFEDSSGNVGIGTASPDAPLTVKGPSYYGTVDIVANSTNGESAINFRPTNLAKDGYGVWLVGNNIGGSANGDFSVYMNGVGKMLTLLQNGNFGIATTSPSEKLEVAGNVKISGSGHGITFPDGTSQATAAVSGDGTTNRGARYTAASVLAAGVIHDDGSKAGVGVTPLSMLDVAGGVAVGGYAGANTAPSNGLIVSGKVGIGTPSPNGLLDIGGKAVALSPSGGDDTGQINAAISALSSAGGGVVSLTGGTFTVGNLTGASNVHLRGAGVGATRLVFSSSYGADPGTAMIWFPANSHDFSVRDITWDAAIANTRPIYADTCNNFDISNCAFINLAAATGPTGVPPNQDTYAIIVRGSNNFRIERNVIIQPNPNGWHDSAILFNSATSADDPASYNAVINENYCEGVGFNIFGYNIKITNNTITNNHAGGCIFIADDAHDPLTRCHDNEITGNIIHDSVGYDLPEPAHPDERMYHSGIENWARHSVIANNVCYRNSGEGIANGAPDCLITNNVCYENGQEGAPAHAAGITLGSDHDKGALYYSSRCVLIGNRCFDYQNSKTQLYGIADQQVGPTNVLISTNHLMDNKIADLNVSADYTIIATDASSGYVGIGVASPGAKLDVGGNVNATGFQAGGTAPSGHYLRGSGAAYVDDTIHAGDIPSLDASKITSGVFDPSQIPGLDAGRITSGQLADARLPADVVTMKDGSTKKIAWGVVQVGALSESGPGTVTVNTGLSLIAVVTITHIWTASANGAGAVSNVNGASGSNPGSFDLNNALDSAEWFYWIAFGT